MIHQLTCDLRTRLQRPRTQRKLQMLSPARPRNEKKQSPTASRDIRTALAVTGVHELMCGRPHCVGAFASRCVGASSCSALTALLPSSSGVNSTPSSLRREHVQPERIPLADPLEYCTLASHLRRWDRKMCKRNATTRQAAPPLQGRLGQRDLRNRRCTEGLAWWPCAAGRELLEPPDYGGACGGYESPRLGIRSGRVLRSFASSPGSRSSVLKGLSRGPGPKF